MIVLPSLSLIINGLIILVVKIFKRDLGITGVTFKAKIIAYAIIFLISLISVTGFVLLINLSVRSHSNAAILVAVAKNWRLTGRFQALAQTPENKESSTLANPLWTESSLFNCQVNLCVDTFYQPPAEEVLSENYLNNSWPHLTYLKKTD